VDRYSFIVRDLHPLLLADLPALRICFPECPRELPVASRADTCVQRHNQTYARFRHFRMRVSNVLNWIVLVVAIAGFGLFGDLARFAAHCTHYQAARPYIPETVTEGFPFQPRGGVPYFR
jgi:hypothetical protein